MSSRPTVSVVIDNFNYEGFVREAIGSVVAQEEPPDELIVVDDGSFDGSVAQIEEALKAVPWARLVSQPNGGQLSAFVRGIEEARGDVVCLLDADDRYRPGHVARVRACFEAHPDVGVHFGPVARFGAEQGGRHTLVPYFGALGRSVLVTAFGAAYLGNVASSMSYRRDVLLPALPDLREHFLRDWRLRADDCLTWVSSLLGARKFQDEVGTVEYRVHAENGFHGKGVSRDERYRYFLTKERFFEYWRRRLFIPPSGLRRLYREYLTSDVRHPARYRAYRNLLGGAYCDLSLAKRLEARLRLAVAHRELGRSRVPLL